MEKLVRETIVKHMSANKLFSNKQFGFISTTLQLLKVMDERPSGPHDLFTSRFCNNFNSSHSLKVFSMHSCFISIGCINGRSPSDSIVNTLLKKLARTSVLSLSVVVFLSSPSSDLNFSSDIPGAIYH
jgi:hypothetical protein